MQLLAVINEPIAKTTLHRCVLACSVGAFKDFRGRPSDPEDLSQHLKHLRKLQLVDNQLQCHPDIVEVITRRTVASGHFEAIVRATRQILPMIPFYRPSDPSFCKRYRRELRVAIHLQDAQLFNKCHALLLDYCSPAYTIPDPLVPICNNPFDVEWFARLPIAWQIVALNAILYSAIWHLEDDQEALAYALGNDCQQQVPERQRAGFDYDLILRFLASGNLARSRALLATAPAREDFLGLRGLLAFLEGDYDQSVVIMNTDLQELRRRARKRNLYFLTFPGVALPLASLLRSERPDYAKLHQLLQQACGQERLPAPLKAAYQSLSAVAHAQQGEVDRARTLLLAIKPECPWGHFFHTTGCFWVEAELDGEAIDALSDIFIAARDAGQHWLAVECAELLCRAEQETPLRRNYIQQVQRDLGLVSFVARIPIEEPWRRRLRALLTTTEVSAATAAPTSKTRLVWLVDYQYEEMMIQPKIQKLTAKGVWSEGRPVALSRLYSGTDLEGFTEQDKAVRATLERRAGSYYNVSYDFNLERALPALVGHPLLFLQSAPRVPVEIVKGEPEVLVTLEKDAIVIKFEPSNIDKSVTVIKETPTRFRVVQFTEQHRHIARIIGDAGLPVPVAAKAEVQAAIAGLSSQMTVHSAIGGQAKDIVAVPPDPVPWAHLLPVGSGFRMELFVKPFSDSGPHLKPGAGMQIVMAEVDGVRLQTRRDLARRKRPRHRRRKRLLTPWTPPPKAIASGSCRTRKIVCNCCWTSRPCRIEAKSGWPGLRGRN